MSVTSSASFTDYYSRAELGRLRCITRSDVAAAKTLRPAPPPGEDDEGTCSSELEAPRPAERLPAGLDGAVFRMGDCGGLRLPGLGCGPLSLPTMVVES